MGRAGTGTPAPVQPVIVFAAPDGTFDQVNEISPPIEQ